jgi:hypothetical protein
MPEYSARFLERYNGFGTSFSDNPDVRAGNDPQLRHAVQSVDGGASVITAATYAGAI